MPLPPPRFSGAVLRTLALAVRTPPGALAARALFRRDLGIDQLARLPGAWRGPTPVDNAVVAGRPPRQGHDERLGAPPGGDWPRGSSALTAAYRAGQLSPQAVAGAALAAARALAGRQPSMGPLMGYDDAGAERDALASEARYRAGQPLGPLDGVPFVVKEETGIAGFPLRLGTTCIAATPVEHDATIVARLRAAGAIVLGQTPMTEYGLSPLGVSARRRLPRNPYRSDRVAGGSSTGSAVAVALGLCPFAIGADGGGSIRIPAAFCGLFGLKPTWGRVSRAGDAFGGTMDHLGPIASTTADLAHFLEACAQPDAADAATRDAPALVPGALVSALGRGVRGLRIGVLHDEFAAATPTIAAACHAALAALEREGATLVPLRL
ncbi:MAG: amidase, partial [Myxococcales bacterium]